VYILIHTGMADVYQNESVGIIVEETLIHEAVHTSLDYEIYQTKGWTQAVLNDNLPNKRLDSGSIK